MATRMTPTKAGLVTLVTMCLIGIAVAVVATASDPAYGAGSRAHARRYGSYAGIVAALAGALAYLGQARRGKR